MKKTMKEIPAETHANTWANRPNAHINNSPEVKAFRRDLLAAMPGWREQQIQKAHRELVLAKSGRATTRAGHG